MMRTAQDDLDQTCCDARGDSERLQQTSMPPGLSLVIHLRQCGCYVDPRLRRHVEHYVRRAASYCMQ